MNKSLQNELKSNISRQASKSPRSISAPKQNQTAIASLINASRQIGNVDANENRRKPTRTQSNVSFKDQDVSYVYMNAQNNHVSIESIQKLVESFNNEKSLSDEFKSDNKNLRALIDQLQSELLVGAILFFILKKQKSNFFFTKLFRTENREIRKKMIF